MLELACGREIELRTDHVGLGHRRGRVSGLGDSYHLVEVLDVRGVDYRQGTVEHQLKVANFGRSTNVANRRREHEMRNVGTPHGLIPLMKCFAGELKGLGEVEFTQRRAPERILDTVTVGVREDRIVGRHGLLDRMDCGIPSIARRLDRGIRLDCDFDELRFRKRSVRGARDRRDQCDSRGRKYQSTAEVCRSHRNSRGSRSPMTYTSPNQKGSVTMTRIGYISRAASAIDN